MNTTAVLKNTVLMKQQNPPPSNCSIPNNNIELNKRDGDLGITRDQKPKNINNKDDVHLSKTNYTTDQESPVSIELTSPTTSQQQSNFTKENKKYIDGSPPNHSQTNISDQYVLKKEDSINPSVNNTRKANTHSGSICFNCKTETTPLWRRDEDGNTLCNACGLFLKLHGTPRPINLKTSVIKSRNRKSNNNRNFSAAKMFRGNFQLSNPFQSGIIGGNRVSKQYIRETDIFPIRDSESIKRFKTSLVRNEKPSKNEHPTIVRATKYIKPPLKPKFTSYEREVYSNGRRYSFPTDNENECSRGNPLSIPSILEPNLSNLKKYASSRKLSSSPHQKNTTLGNNGSLSSSGSESESSKNVAGDSTATLSEYLSNEEDVIKLRTRIKELELVTDLYKDYIFRINEKCQHLEAIIQSTYNQN